MTSKQLKILGILVVSQSIMAPVGQIPTGAPMAKAQGILVQRPDGPPGQAQPPAVDVAVARTGTIADNTLDYTATTQPLEQATLRSRSEGLVLELRVDVGDPVQKDQVIGRVDDLLLQADLAQAQAELAAREADVLRAQTQILQAQTQVERERVALQQAQADAQRLTGLAQEGALSQQEAEQAQTTARTAEQAFRSAENQVDLEEQGLVASRERVRIQQAVIQQIQERQSQTLLRSPMDGIVLSRLISLGDLVRPGEEVLTVGNLSQSKLVLQLSELDLGRVQLGQQVTARLDAFGDEPFMGQISRISPVADPAARLIPVEILIPNPDGRISSGLLARVQIQVGEAEPRVVVPESALQSSTDGDPVVYVAARTGESVLIEARSVAVGSRSDGQVEILSGLEEGEPYVTRADGQLQDGQTVRLSILSEWQN